MELGIETKRKEKRSDGTILALYAFPLARPLKVQQPFQVHCIPRNPTEVVI
jgi:hypothetical protein